MSDALPARRRRRRWLIAGAALVCLVAACVGGLLYAVRSAVVDIEVTYSASVLDRNDQLLRAYTTPDGRWRLAVDAADVDPRMVDLLLHYEDKRFRSHPGVDLVAMVRAAWQFVRHGRIVSGGSTITMQVVRLLEPRRERSVQAKLREMIYALALERKLSKDQILSLYLSLAPYGGNLEGIRAGSLAYFGKEPRRLTLGEAALLVSLPQSPEARRPDRSAARAQAARDRVLRRLAPQLASADVERAHAESVPAGRQPMPAYAPHAADDALAREPSRTMHRLTIDLPLQRTLEQLARERARAVGGEVSVAIVAVDHATGEILARVGSPDYLDEGRAGQVDMTKAVRSPGSALKPFIYGLAFEDGIAHPETLIDDRPVRYGVYAPENFDLGYQGTVSVRRALQYSLNVPAVLLLDAVRPSRFTARVGAAGANLLLPKGEGPGLAMGLGGVGISLADLTALYAGIARYGTTIPLAERAGEGAPAVGAPRRLLDPVAAWYVANVLVGTPPPENAPAGRIAFKTGTSYGYRDAWSVGFDGGMTIGVWVGRPDGAPVPGMIGRTVAAPILFEAFARSGRHIAPLPGAPKGAIVLANPRLPPPLQRFRPAGQLAERGGNSAPKIMFPPNGARLELARGAETEPMPLKISGGVGPLTVLVNGLPVPLRGGRTVFWRPDGPGFVRLTVLDGQGASDSVVVRLQ